MSFKEIVSYGRPEWEERVRQERTIDVSVDILRAVGGHHSAAVFLARACFLQNYFEEKFSCTWWPRTARQWKIETHLSRAQQARIRKKLKGLGFLQEKPKNGYVYFQVNYPRLLAATASQNIP